MDLLNSLEKMALEAVAIELVIVVQAAVASRKRVRWMRSEGVEGFSA